MAVIMVCPNPACRIPLNKNEREAGRCTRCQTTFPPGGGVPSDSDFPVWDQSGLVIEASAYVEPEYLVKLRSRQKSLGGVAQKQGLFGKYQIHKKMSDSSTAKVYYAFDTELRRPVALKVLQLNDPGNIKRFQREAQSAARIDHPNFCQIYEIGEISGIYYLALEYVEGQTLAELIESNARPFSIRNAVAFVRRVALALAVAHENNVVHRDLKPANIMVDPRGAPVIIDFGMAKMFDVNQTQLTKFGCPFGTPCYMPPEQVYGDLSSIGHSVDIYALGVILFELLAGRRPYVGDSHLAIFNQITSSAPPPLLSVFRPGVDPRLETLCTKAMAKTIAKRYVSMEEFAESLEKYLAATASQQDGIAKSLSGSGLVPAFPATPSDSNPNISALSPAFEAPASATANDLAKDKDQDQDKDKDRDKSQAARAASGAKTAASSSAGASATHNGAAGAADAKEPASSAGMAQAQRYANGAPASVLNARGTRTLLLTVAAGDEGDFPTIQQAIRKAMAGSRIYVRPGVYREPLVIDKAIELIGDGPQGSVIIDVAGHACIRVESEDVVIRGFTLRSAEVPKHNREGVAALELRGEKILVEDCDIQNCRGYAGVSIQSYEANPILRRCTVRNGDSFGIMAYAHCRGLLEDCTITKNAKAGIILGDEAALTARKCRIVENLESGVFVHNKAKGLIQDCLIASNAKAGVTIGDNGDARFLQCKIGPNPRSGVFCFSQGAGTFEDCDIFQSQRALVILTDGGNPHFIRCTFRESQDAGVLVVGETLGFFDDCEMTLNRGPGVKVKRHGNPTLRKCRIVQGLDVGLSIYGMGKGRLEECLISHNAKAGAIIWRGADPELVQCEISHNGAMGVWFFESGLGRLMQCSIQHNAGPGVEIERQARPAIQSCRILDNRRQAIVIHDDGSGAITDCDLSGNRPSLWQRITRQPRGPWKIEPGCQVQLERNHV